MLNINKSDEDNVDNNNDKKILNVNRNENNNNDKIINTNENYLNENKNLNNEKKLKNDKNHNNESLNVCNNQQNNNKRSQADENNKNKDQNENLNVCDNECNKKKLNAEKNNKNKNQNKKKNSKNDKDLNKKKPNQSTRKPKDYINNFFKDVDVRIEEISKIIEENDMNKGYLLDNTSADDKKTEKNYNSEKELNEAYIILKNRLITYKNSCEEIKKLKEDGIWDLKNKNHINLNNNNRKLKGKVIKSEENVKDLKELLKNSNENSNEKLNENSNENSNENLNEKLNENVNENIGKSDNNINNDEDYESEDNDESEDNEEIFYDEKMVINDCLIENIIDENNNDKNKMNKLITCEETKKIYEIVDNKINDMIKNIKNRGQNETKVDNVIEEILNEKIYYTRRLKNGNIQKTERRTALQTKILRLLRYINKLEKEKARNTDIKKVRDEMNNLIRKRIELNDKGQLSEKEKGKFISMKTLRNIVEKYRIYKNKNLENEDIQENYMLILLQYMICPRRVLDYSEMIISDDISKLNKELIIEQGIFSEKYLFNYEEEKEEISKINEIQEKYIIYEKQMKFDKKNYYIRYENKSYFVFCRYKMDKYYGNLIIKLDDSLGNEIENYISATNKKIGDKFLNINRGNYSNRIKNLFKKMIGRSVTVSILRKVYISHCMYSRMLNNDINRKRLSTLMSHSKLMQQYYGKDIYEKFKDEILDVNL